MKTLYIAAFVMILFNSCKKANLDPITSDQEIEGGATEKATSFNITFELPVQAAVTQVDQNKLTIVYTEKVALLVDTKEYNTSWGLHLTENFAQSALAHYDFTTITQHGHKTFNWVDDNLNNVIVKSKSDTVVNSKTLKKVVIERQFTFVKEYDNRLAATNAQKALLLRKDDVIGFTSFYYSTNKELVPIVGSAKVQYTIAPSANSGS